MNVGNWFSLRGPQFICRRGSALLRRYGLTPTKAQNRILSSTASLALRGCAVTFLIPGRVAKRYSSFIRHLQDQGVEIAVHSYDHIDLKALLPSEAVKQLIKAVETFELLGLESHGFRCPYLSCNDELLDALPGELFSYSSNAAIRWELNSLADNARARVILETIDKFYQPRNSQDVVCVPWLRNKLVEIPVCVPDDLQLHDGLGMDAEEIAKAWNQILDQTHRRGELFTLIFHPELADFCEQPIIAVLQEARRLNPDVWIAKLRDISDWWLEKSKFHTEVSLVSARLRIAFVCSSRAAILAKGLDTLDSMEAWGGTYFRLKTPILEAPIKPRPFIGVASDVPRSVVSFLQNQGYILDLNETAPQCAIYLDNSGFANTSTQVELINWIEQSEGPLVRYWRWPDGAKSALSVTGDLDALSLLDYVSRLFVR